MTHVPAGLQDSLQGKPVQRITFTEVTKKAVLEAIKAPRSLSMPLVEAYLARRALDYLLGFTVSPVLWTKCASLKSAGEALDQAHQPLTLSPFRVDAGGQTLQDYASISACDHRPDWRDGGPQDQLLKACL